LAAAIESVQQQTVQPKKVVVVDDGSTDGSREFAERLGCTVLSTGQNAGPSRARNVGVSECSADMIAFLDADDTWEPWHLEHVVALDETVPGMQVLFAAIEPCGANSMYERPRVPANAPVQLSERLLGENVIAQSAAVVRRSALLDIGGYDESMRFSEDYDLWLRLSRESLFAHTGSASVRYRVHDNQSSMRRACLTEGAWRARLKHFAWLEDTGRSASSAAAKACLQDAFDRDLSHAWYYKDVEYFERTLRIGHAVPFLSGVVARWESRRRWFWYLSVAGRRAYDTLPVGWRGLLKRVLVQ
jgi:glycosyltransferase involved in cell wall biosynthesis